MTTAVESRDRVSKADVQHYLDRGHWGYILDYRSRHDGSDPDPRDLDALVELSEERRLGPMSRLLRGVLDAVR